MPKRSTIQDTHIVSWQEGNVSRQLTGFHGNQKIPLSLSNSRSLILRQSSIGGKEILGIKTQ